MTKAIGKRVRSKRNERGWTQAALAGRIGVHGSEISDLECGRRNFSSGRLKRLAKVLRVSADWLLGLRVKR